MQTTHKRFSVVLGFILLLMLLVVNGLVTRRQLGVQVGAQDWVTHTQQVLFELSQTESLIKDAETGQRGYLYTEDSKYLAPYNSAISQIDPHIDELARLTADNPPQQERISRLRDLKQAKITELAQAIAIYRSGKPDSAKALVLSDRGRLLMESIHELIGEMASEENSLAVLRAPP